MHGGVLPRLGPLAALAALALAGCVSNPPKVVPRSPWGKIQRALAIDFSNDAVNRRTAGLLSGVTLLAGELERVPGLFGALEGRVAAEAGRANGVPKTVVRLAGGELQRAERVYRLPSALPNPDRLAMTLANDLAALPWIFGFDHRPLSHPLDREHRTDPHDDRPEAGLWERLSRRILP